MVWNGKKLVKSLFVKDQGSILQTILGQFVFIFLFFLIWDEHSCTLVIAKKSIREHHHYQKNKSSLSKEPKFFILLSSRWEAASATQTTRAHSAGRTPQRPILDRFNFLW